MVSVLDTGKSEGQGMDGHYFLSFDPAANGLLSIAITAITPAGKARAVTLILSATTHQAHHLFEIELRVNVGVNHDGTIPVPVLKRIKPHLSADEHGCQPRSAFWRVAGIPVRSLREPLIRATVNLTRSDLPGKG